MTKKQKTPRREPGTLTALEKGLSLSKRQVSALLGKGMPSDLTAARRWRRERADLAPDYATARARKMQADAERSEIALKKERGTLMDRQEVFNRERGIGNALQAFWRALEREAPAALLGLPMDRAMPTFKNLLRTQQKYIADESSHFWKSHPETIDPEKP